MDPVAPLREARAARAGGGGAGVGSAREDVFALFAAAARILARGWLAALVAMLVVGGGAMLPAFLGLCWRLLGNGNDPAGGFFIFSAILGAPLSILGMSSGALSGFYDGARTERSGVRTAVVFGALCFPRIVAAWIAVGCVFATTAAVAAIAFAAGVTAFTDREPGSVFCVLPLGAIAACGAWLLFSAWLAPTFVLAPILVVDDARGGVRREPGRLFDRRIGGLQSGHRELLAIAALAPVAVLAASQPSAIGLALAAKSQLIDPSTARVLVAIVGALVAIYVHALFAAAAFDVVTRARDASPSDAA